MKGYPVGRKKARRFMTEMGIDAIYPKMNLSKRMQAAKVCPYLLRHAVITRPNQAWSIDITYIPLKKGHVFLTAIIDWYSRCIVGWDIDDTWDTRMVINACKKAMRVVSPVDAHEYLVKGSFDLRDKQVYYLYSTVTKTEKQKSGGSSGGGSSYSSGSSSGGSYSSGGRSF